MTRFLNLFRRRRLDGQMDEEFQFHLDLLTTQFINKGMNREEAERQARRHFGSVDAVQEAYRDQRGVAWISDFLADLRHGARLLRRDPGFSAVAVLTMALGIGANSAIFSFVNAVYLRPAPYPNADRLVDVVNEVRGRWNGPTHTSRRYLYFKEHAKSFEEVAASRGGGATTLILGGEAFQVSSLRVSHNYFRALGVEPLAGRFFLSEEDEPGGEKVAILGHGLWQRRFGGNLDALNQTIDVGGEAHTIVGIARADPVSRAGLFLPNRARPVNDGTNTTVIGLLREGVSMEQGSQDLNQAMQNYKREFAAEQRREFHREATARAAPFGSWMRQFSTPLGILSAAVALILLVACGNLANLLLARATARVREIAIRLSVGAGRGRMIRQLLAESLLIAFLGAVVGLLLARWTLPALVRLNPIPISTLTPITIDWVVVAFTAALAIGTTLLFGLFPAFAATRLNAHGALKETGSNCTARGRTGLLRKSLVAAEVALSLILLIGAGLLVRTLVKLISVHPGVDATNVLAAKMPMQGQRYGTTAKGAALFRRGLDRLRDNPAVEFAAVVNNLPMERGLNLVALIPGSESADDWKLIDWRFVSADYFRLLRIPLQAGRLFNEADSGNAERVAIVNQEFVRRYLGKENPVGRLLQVVSGKSDPHRTIVGVVGDVKSNNFRVPAQPTVFVPVDQATDEHFRIASGYFPVCWLIRGRDSRSNLTTFVESELKSLDPLQPVSGITPLEELRQTAVQSDRSMMILLSGFAILALVLSAAGIYGVMSYTVAQRAGEIGIRLALGASIPSMIGSVVRQGAVVAFLGVIAGVGAAIGLTRFLQAFMFGVKPADPLTFAVASLFLLGVAAVASLVPALRIARLDPVRALRAE